MESVLYEGNRSFESDWTQVLWESLTDEFHSYVYRNLLKNFIFTHFLLLEDFEQGAPLKELIIATFLEWFEKATLGKC